MRPRDMPDYVVPPREARAYVSVTLNVDALGHEDPVGLSLTTAAGSRSWRVRLVRSVREMPGAVRHALIGPPPPAVEYAMRLYI
jgi:hypothetical protein